MKKERVARNLRATVEYDGTDFRGFQIQAADRTVQGVLEEAFAKLLGEPISIIGAGRTDAGVHATGQVCSFRTSNPLPEATIERGVNALLPADVAITSVGEVDDDFHARYSATGRTYAYRIANAPRPRPLLRRTSWWVSDPLDAAALEAASRHLVGRHDFSSFSMKVEGTRERTVRRATWSKDGDLLTFEIEADAFLRGMVRGIVGTLVRVGRGKLDAEAFARVVESGDRDTGGPSAPANGLCLVRVTYGQGRRSEPRARASERDDEDE